MDQERNKNYLPFVFHGQQTFTNESKAITGNFPKMGWMNVSPSNSNMYIGSEEVGGNGLKLISGRYFRVNAASLDRWHVSGNGTINFAGSYAK